MKRLSINPVVKATGIIGVVAALTTGVTFAALQSQATLAQNNLSTVTTGLALDGPDSDSIYSDNEQGFEISEFLPGTGKTQNFSLNNNGSANLSVSAHVPEAPTTSGFSDLSAATVVLASPVCPTAVNTTVAALVAGEVALPCGNLPFEPGATNANVRTYSAHFDITSSAINASHAGVSDFDITVTGVAVE